MFDYFFHAEKFFLRCKLGEVVSAKLWRSMYDNHEKVAVYGCSEPTSDTWWKLRPLGVLEHGQHRTSATEVAFTEVLWFPMFPNNIN